MIETCRIVAIEGSHGSGKTTLAHALAAHYKSRGLNAGLVADVARRSPFVEDAVVHGAGPFTIFAELHILASQVAEEQLLARHHQLLICDRSVANVLAYAELLIESDAATSRMIAAMRQFAETYSALYDRVFVSHDLYDLNLTNDPYRPQDQEFQRRAHAEIVLQCSALGIQTADIPQGLTLAERVAWVANDGMSLP